MPHYNPPLRDMKFVLHETLQIHARPEIEGYGELAEDLTSAILNEAGKLAAEVILPTNQAGDHEGCVLENGVVRTPTGFRAAFDALREGGWPSLECDPEYGGQGMPNVVTTCVAEMQSAANMALMMYPGLTHGAYSALHAFGSDEQKRKVSAEPRFRRMDRNDEPHRTALRHGSRP